MEPAPQGHKCVNEFHVTIANTRQSAYNEKKFILHHSFGGFCPWSAGLITFETVVGST